jgi:hypothetical protein
MYHAYMARVDYCDALFASLTAVTLALLRRVMNAAVCFLYGLGPRDHTSNAICIMMHTVVRGTAP